LFAKSHVLPLGFHVFTGKALQINWLPSACLGYPR
jgi:hypothetical protein